MKILIFLALVTAAQPLLAQERVSHGRFKDVRLYRPAGEVKNVVLFLSGDNGWDKPVIDMARKLVERGAMVAGIDTQRLYAELEADGADCVYPDGDLENLSHYLQGYARLPTYYTPLLVGYSSGATMAYAMVAQAQAGTFAGAISVGFCAELDLAKPLCPGAGVRFSKNADGRSVNLLPTKDIAADWAVLQGTRDQICPAAPARAFANQVTRNRFFELPNTTHSYANAALWSPPLLESYDRITASAAATLPPPPASLAELPLIAVRAAKPGATFAVLLSGDGGWAGIDKELAAALSRQGMEVVGLDSLRYFWTRRTPQGLATDLDRVVRYYAALWRKSGVVLIGYSQGADVLPFAINRLPPASRQLVTHSVLMGLGMNASFEFHIGNWIGKDKSALPILPEARKLQPGRTLCIYGKDEKDSLCPRLAPGNVEALALPGGHHFDGAYDDLAALILERTTR